MSRQFAGILGPLGFSTCVARGVIHGSSTDETLIVALLALLALSVAGAVLGAIAGWTVEESVRARLVAEMAAREKQPSVPPGGSVPAATPR